MIYSNTIVRSNYYNWYLQVNDLKKTDPNLKTLLAVGGWTHASEGFTQMVKTESTRRKFIIEAAQYVMRWGKLPGQRWKVSEISKYH